MNKNDYKKNQDMNKNDYKKNKMNIHILKNTILINISNEYIMAKIQYCNPQILFLIFKKTKNVNKTSTET